MGYSSVREPKNPSTNDSVEARRDVLGRLGWFSAFQAFEDGRGCEGVRPRAQGRVRRFETRRSIYAMIQNLDKVKRLAKDLRREEPRPPSEELGGYPLAARCLDKCRATLVGWQGDFTYNCPLDQEYLGEAELDAEEFK